MWTDDRFNNFLQSQNDAPHVAHVWLKSQTVQTQTCQATHSLLVIIFSPKGSFEGEPISPIC